MPTQSIDLSAVTDANFNGSAVDAINLNGTEIWIEQTSFGAGLHLMEGGVWVEQTAPFGLALGTTTVSHGLYWSGSTMYIGMLVRTSGGDWENHSGVQSMNGQNFSGFPYKQMRADGAYNSYSGCHRFVAIATLTASGGFTPLGLAVMNYNYTSDCQAATQYGPATCTYNAASCNISQWHYQASMGATNSATSYGNSYTVDWVNNPAGTITSYAQVGG